MFDLIKTSAAWNNALNTFEHDFYHTWDFHYISHLNGEGVPVLFRFNHDGESVIFPLLERDIDGDSKDLVSVYGYPGPLFSCKDVDMQNILISKLFDKIKSLGYVSLFSRLHPLLNNKHLDKSTQLSDIVYFDLNDSLEKIYGEMRKVHRRDIRNLKKSSFILKQYSKPSDKQIKEFKNIYDLNMDMLNASDFYYFDEDYYKKIFDSSEFKALLFTVYLDSTAIASAIMIQTGGICEYHLSGTLSDFYKSNAMKLILGSALEKMHDKGLKYFILGGGVGSIRDSLFDFKYGFSRRTTSFHIIKKIFNLKVYKKLCDERFKELNIGLEKLETINFFPLYRYDK